MLDILIQNANEVLGSYRGGILNALVWGVDAGLGWGTKEDFARVGLIHVLVASGANVVFLVEAVVNVLAWLVGRKKAIFFGLVLGWGYAVAVGFGPSLVRGVLFVTLRYVSVILGRGFSWARGLLLVLLISCLADRRLFFSDSMWLSVAAFVGVSSFAEVWKLKNRAWSSKLLEEFMKGLWIAAWVLPLVAIKFGVVSVWSPLVGALTFWIYEPLVLLGVMAGVVFVIFPFFGEMLYWLADKLLDCLMWIVLVFRDFWGGEILVEINWLVLVVWYGVLLVVFLRQKSTIYTSC